jgi:CRP-like cAMP-binding protein
MRCAHSDRLAALHPFHAVIVCLSRVLCRESLCKDMQLIVLEKGETAIKSGQDREFVWFIVVKGRCDMLVRAEAHGKQFPLRVFEEGETFAMPVCLHLLKSRSCGFLTSYVPDA